MLYLSNLDPITVLTFDKDSFFTVNPGHKAFGEVIYPVQDTTFVRKMDVSSDMECNVQHWCEACFFKECSFST